MLRTVVTRSHESSPPVRPRRRSALFWLVVVVGALTLAPSGAASADEWTRLRPARPSESSPVEARVDEPDRVTEITVSPLEAFPGDAVHVTGTCTWRGSAASEVHLSLQHWDNSIDSVGFSVPIDANTGVIDADVIVPLETHPGQSNLGWMCLADDMIFGWHQERIPFMVLGTPPTDPPTPPGGATGTGGSVDVDAIDIGSSPEAAGTLAASGAVDTTPAALAVAGLALAGAAAVGLAAVSRRRSARSRQ